jgi:hypothetical protein
LARSRFLNSRMYAELPLGRLFEIRILLKLDSFPPNPKLRSMIADERAPG